MATTLQLVYDIKEYLKKYSDDSDLPNDYILYLYNIKRAKALRRLLNDYTRKFDNVIKQTLCLGIERVDRATCGISCEYIMRSIKPIPSLIDLRSRSTLLRVGEDSIGGDDFKIINIEQANKVLLKPFSYGIYAFIDSEGYIYLVSNSSAHMLLECITITAIFETPSDLQEFSSCCDGCEEEMCFSEDTDYPLQGFLIDEISSEIKSQLAARFNIPEDNNNDSTNDELK